MRKLIDHLDWGAIFAALVVGYSVPVIMACVLSSAVWLMWFWILAPICAGYLVAKLAVKVPLIHGLAVSVVGLLVFGLLAPPRSIVAWLIWMAVNLSCSIFGAWLWRQRSRKPV